MPTAERAKLEYEAGQTFFPFEALTDSGDHLNFSSSGSRWSNRAGYTPEVRPNGLITGGAVIPAVSGSDNLVDVAALSCYLAGVNTSVAADTDVAVTRGTSPNVYIIHSITINSSGAVAVVSGTGSTAFSETRGAAGGPPLIPTTSIEIAQVRLSSDTANPVLASEIFSVVGVHQERYDFPLWTVDRGTGEINFASALPLIHTGPVAKAVYAQFYEPIFAEAPRTADFVPPETSHSVSSTQIYNGTIGSSSSSLSQGSFTLYPQDGITDGLIALKNEDLWFKFYQDRNKTPYIATQGKLGIGRTFPASNELACNCTISATEEATEFAS